MDALLEDTNDDDDDDDNKTEFRRQRDNNLEQFDRAFANIWQFTGGFTRIVKLQMFTLEK